MTARWTMVSAGLVAAALAATPALAQSSKGPPNALQGFSQNRDQPVQIEAATLEVREKEKQATFSGNVKVTQGDTGLRSKSLVVFYEDSSGQDKADQTKADQTKPDQTRAGNGKAAGSMTQANPTPGFGGGQQQIKRLEAKGGVVVTQKDQTVTGDAGVFDMRTNTVTMTGNVVMTQGQNVLRGDRLVVDLGTGVSRVESGKSGAGRVQGLFHSGGVKPEEAGKNTGKDAGKDTSKGRGEPGMPTMPAPRQPLRLN
ncbi:MAG TPA: LptA/OstA family protein [Pseudolabrys sp.]|nr:LptA/OstA family protein [Pseudolabrys sp.]